MLRSTSRSREAQRQSTGWDWPTGHGNRKVDAIRWSLWLSGMALASAIAMGALTGSYSAGSGVAHGLAGLLLAWCVVAFVLSTRMPHVVYRLPGRKPTWRLGQYTLEHKIGEGGMGVVFRARHAMLRRPTVVKLLPPERAGAANLVRFEREVQLTSQLSSPNTVAVYDFGRTPDGIFYYAMEYLDGVDLEELVAIGGPQPAARVIHLLTQVCSGLAEAHGVGLVHRDIKPSNVMLCRQGGQLDVVKLLDFGLVKDVVRTDDVRLTHESAFLGTPLYLSPEAISQPHAVDGRSDLYAVGGLGYFLLTGRPVFTGRNPAELCAKHLYEAPVPPSHIEPSAPRDLESVLLACLAKSPEARPKDATALRLSLLGCADAGRWSEADARAWWQARGPAPPRAAALPSGSATTVPIAAVRANRAHDPSAAS
jgi:eukaryotic-like serine/threonine-protein kinase